MNYKYWGLVQDELSLVIGNVISDYRGGGGNFEIFTIGEPILVIFICFSNFNGTFCKQTVTTQTTQYVASDQGMLCFHIPMKLTLGLNMG